MIGCISYIFEVPTLIHFAFNLFNSRIALVRLKIVTIKNSPKEFIDVYIHSLAITFDTFN